MANYFVRKTGLDANAGTSAGAAWLTIGKALSATGIASGDTLYIGAGIYREVVNPAMTSATVETKIIGDVDGVMTGDAGEVRITGYTTNDTTLVASGGLVLSGRNFLTFQDIAFVSANNTLVLATTNTSTDIIFRRCLFHGGGLANTAIFSVTSAANVALNWVIDSCTFIHGLGAGFTCTPVRPATADFNINVVIKNCLFIGGAGVPINLASPSGANVFNPGGVTVYNCTGIKSGNFAATASANWSTTFPCYIYNCLIYSGSTTFNAGATGQIIENYNVMLSGATPRTNVAVGANSKSDGSYSPLFYTGHEYSGVGSNLKPFGMPKPGSPLLGFGNQAGSPTVDILGITRPAIGSVGCYELGNSAVRETITIRTGSNAIKITGSGYQDFAIPVNATSTTINVFGRYDGSYAGTLPSLNVVNGTECGVANATDTMVVAAGTWEMLSLTVVPTSKGIITIRLISNTTAVSGAAFFDDFSIN